MIQLCVSWVLVIDLLSLGHRGQRSHQELSSKARCTGHFRPSMTISILSTTLTPEGFVPSGCMSTGYSFHTLCCKCHPWLLLRNWSIWWPKRIWWLRIWCAGNRKTHPLSGCLTSIQVKHQYPYALTMTQADCGRLLYCRNLGMLMWLYPKISFRNPCCPNTDRRLTTLIDHSLLKTLWTTRFLRLRM